MGFIDVKFDSHYNPNKDSFYDVAYGVHECGTEGRIGAIHCEPQTKLLAYRIWFVPDDDDGPVMFQADNVRPWRVEEELGHFRGMIRAHYALPDLT